MVCASRTVPLVAFIAAFPASTLELVAGKMITESFPLITVALLSGRLYASCNSMSPNAWYQCHSGRRSFQVLFPGFHVYFLVIHRPPSFYRRICWWPFWNIKSLLGSTSSFSSVHACSHAPLFEYIDCQWSFLVSRRDHLHTCCYCLLSPMSSLLGSSRSVHLFGARAAIPGVQCYQ